MSRVREIEKLLEPVAKQEKIEIVDVQYIKENGDWIVRIFIDKDDGIAMSDCERVTHIFSNVLDKSGILKESYVLEISSPGLNRVLKKEESFERFIGSKVKIQTLKPINNQRIFLGKLLDFSDGIVKINDVTNGVVDINFLDIKKANVEIDI